MIDISLTNIFIKIHLLAGFLHFFKKNSKKVILCGYCQIDSQYFHQFQYLAAAYYNPQYKERKKGTGIDKYELTFSRPDT